MPPVSTTMQAREPLPWEPSGTDLRWPTGLKDLIAKATEAKMPFRQVWEACDLYVRGYQNLTFDRTKGSISPQVVRAGRNRLAVNHMLPTYRTIYSRLSVDYPSIIVVPAASTTDNIAKARASSIAARHHWEAQHMEVLFQKALAPLIKKGTAAFHTYYDTGDKTVHTVKVGPEDLFFEAGAKCEEESSFIAVRTIVLRDDLIRLYPNKEKEIRELSSYKAETVSISTRRREFQSDRISLYDVYWQDGRHALVAGESLYLYQGTRKTKRIPVRVMRYTSVDDDIWGMGLVEALMDIQDIYNQRRSQIADNADLMGNPVWLNPSSANINPKHFTNRPGSVIPYNALGGVKPEIMQPPSMPSYVLQDVSTLQGEFYDVGALHSISRGKRAIGLASGEAIKALTANDTSGLQMTMDSMEAAAAGVAEDALCLMRVYYTEQRVMKTYDTQSQYIVASLKDTDLLDDPEIVIKAGSLFRMNKEDREKRAIDLATNKLIPPEEALEDIDFGSSRRKADQHAQQLAHANDVLGALVSGKATDIEVYITDDLKAFTDVFGEYMQSDPYYALPPPMRKKLRDIFVACAAPPDPSVAVTGVVYPKPPMPVAPPAPSAPPPGGGFPQAPTNIQTGTVTAGGEPSDLMPQTIPEAEVDVVPANTMGAVG